MREPISLKDLLAVFVRKGKTIVLLAVIFALLLGGYQLNKVLTLDEASSQQIYQDQLAEYEATLGDLEKQLERAEEKYTHDLEYSQNSIVANLNPDKVYRCTQYYVITYNLEGRSSDTSAAGDASYFVNAIQQHYRYYFELIDLTEEMKADKLPEMKEEYWRELVYLDVLDGGVMKLSIYGDSEEMVKTMADRIRQLVEQIHEELMTKTYPHEFELLQQQIAVMAVEGFEATQETLKVALKEYAVVIKDLTAQINSLEKPVQGDVVGMKSALTAVAKGLLLGGAAGMFAGILWVLLVFVLKDTVEGTHQLEQMLGVPCLGTAAEKVDIWNRMAGKIMAERCWADALEAWAYLEQSIKNADLADGFVVATTLSTKTAKKSMQRLQETVLQSGPQTVFVTDAYNNPQMLAALQNGKGLILAEKIGVSSVRRMRAVITLAERMNVPVAGFVTL